ncbi:unnamed protein product [Prorocentrum cordatum]|uniref:Uncharacterized protein n=1 Tax=Prorocentrum cordatum TaxID=2364126 RepID=A0ABN9PCT0_9DINO|nr:unnamed protein product [Polarella glacialis]
MPRLAVAVAARVSLGLAALEQAAGWVRSFQAGYVDASGRYAGGSEVMHLVPHRGVLYAGVGYWEDQRFLEGQSGAQVLRLDSPDAAWQVDLECGPQHMKLNILKEVTFTRGAAGQPLAQPVTLLLAAAGRSRGPGTPTFSVSVFTRNDGDGNWTETTVAQGSPRLGRWLPRALEVHRDSVTGLERVFLCIGNPGVLAGVYDPSKPGQIRWDAAPEISGLRTRPLAMAVAGGRLYFSAGYQIYQRIDGVRPSWRVALAMNSSSVNPDSGGIRGLTRVATPGAPNGSCSDSLLFMWAPSGRSRGCIYRVSSCELAPDGERQPALVLEACAAPLMSEALGTAVGYTLGAYNRMFAVRDPATGEPVHLVGLEGRVPGATEGLQWNGYYAGAMFALRWSSGARYSVNEVNGRYRPGGPPLEAVRAFAMSPFPAESASGPVLYTAGFDTNFNPATNMAWIFKANLSLALAPPQEFDSWGLSDGVSPGLAVPSVVASGVVTAPASPSVYV